jgi:hypothetical protein
VSTTSSAPQNPARAGDRHAARALALLGRWNRAANWHLMFAGPCACCVGDAQLAHLENQAIAILLERFAGDTRVEPLLLRCRAEALANPEGARALGRLMRAVVTERDAAVSAGHPLLLDALEAVLGNLEGDGT